MTSILEYGQKGGFFGEARSPLSLLLCQVLQPICGAIVFIRNVSIFPFSVGFSENQRHLSGVSFGSREHGCELNMLENKSKGGHLKGARSPLPLQLC